MSYSEVYNTASMHRDCDLSIKPCGMIRIPDDDDLEGANDYVLEFVSVVKQVLASSEQEGVFLMGKEMANTGSGVRFRLYSKKADA